jgi:cytochrome c peroxidase
LLRRVILIAGALMAWPCWSQQVDEHARYTRAELAAVYAHAPPGEPPPDPSNRVADRADAAQLGRTLFHDQRLSANGRIACATCHQPAHAFTDGLPTARALATGNRNTPTLLNAAFNQWFFWDGRCDTQWSQALQPIEDTREAGIDRLYVLHVIAQDSGLNEAYRSLFGSLPPLQDAKRFPPHASPAAAPRSTPQAAWTAMTAADRTAVDTAYANLGKALEAYERQLVGRGSPFDRYVAALKADGRDASTLLSDGAKRGLKLFVGAGRCELCHSGPRFSDGQFHNLGLPLLPHESADEGRAAGIRGVLANPFNAAGPFSDAHAEPSQNPLSFLPPPASQSGAFKTPSLREVALTAPYMHDGRFETLSSVLDFYAAGRAASHGRVIGVREGTLDLVPHFNQQQKDDLVAFLQTLSSPPVVPQLTTDAR